jgi:hypothetical protein
MRGESKAIFMKQNAAITFELEETVVLKQGGKIATDFCPQCQTDVDMISPDVLALLAESSEREIFRLIEAGLIHFIEPDRVLACARCYRKSLTDDRRYAEVTLPKIAEANKE